MVSRNTQTPVNESLISAPMYIAYIHIDDLYAQFDKYNITYTKWELDPVADDCDILYDYTKVDKPESMPSYIYRVDCISYASLVNILDDMYTWFEKIVDYKQIVAMNCLVVKLTDTFPAIHVHLDYYKRCLNV